MAINTILSNSEILEFDTNTGEILVSGSYSDFTRVQQTKIKALKLLNSNDFIQINGVWEAKRDALIKILSSLPISYSWHIKERQLNDNCSQILGELTITSGKVTRSADALGICELAELKGNGGLHFMQTRAETRAIKRAIDVLFGSVINYYVVNYLR